MVTYQDVKMPEELYFYMRNFKYGYLTKEHKVIAENKPNCNDYWYKNYILQSTSDLIRTQTGNCFDQTEFARSWFEENNYEVMTFHEQIKNHINLSHSFVIFKDKRFNNRYSWFEIAWKRHAGIKSNNNLYDLLRYNYKLYLEELSKNGITSQEDILLFKFNTPKKHSTIYEYLNNISKGKKLSLKKK